MTIEEALYTEVIAVVGHTRFYPVGHAPEAPTVPYGTYQKITGERLYKFGGPLATARPLIQINWFGSTAKQAKDQLELVRALLSGNRDFTFGGPTGFGVAVLLEDERDMGKNPKTGNFHRWMAFRFIHDEA